LNGILIQEFTQDLSM